MLFLRDESDVIMILVPHVSGKRTTIHSITKIVDNLLHGSVLRLGTTVMVAFVIDYATFHSTLRLPISRQFIPLQGPELSNIQGHLYGKKWSLSMEYQLWGEIC